MVKVLNHRDARFRIIIGMIIFFCHSAFVFGAPANTTTVGSLVVVPLFESLHVYGNFSDDGNSNNSAVVKWRTSPSGTWYTAYNAGVDRRTSLPAGTPANAYSNQVRTIIFGCQANTAYDVWIDWNDSDGITSGDGNVTNTVTTLTLNVPTNGIVTTVGDDTELGLALGSSLPGDTIELETGIYKPINITISGSESGWIVIKNASGATPQIKGTNDNNIYLDANYIKIQGIVFPESDTSTIYFDTAQHHIMVQDCIMTNVNTTLAANGQGGVAHKNNGSATNIYVINCTMQSSGNIEQDYGVTMGNDAPNAHNWYIVSNRIHRFWDSVGGGADALGRGFCMNWYVAYNTLTLPGDDCIEVDGEAVNCLLLKNYMTGTNSGAGNPSGLTSAAISLAPVMFGPLFAIGNRMILTNGESGCFKLGGDGTECDGYVLAAHNSGDQRYSTISGQPFASEAGSGSCPTDASHNHFWYNNIQVSRGTTVSRSGDVQGSRSNFHNFNMSSNTVGGNIWGNFNITNCASPDGNSYTTAAGFFAGQGDEQNGIGPGEPSYSNYTEMTLSSSSAARNAGTILVGINDFPTSPVLYSGSAPDMGAMEFSEATTNHIYRGKISFSGKVTLR